ncbi:MAG: 3-deoxy-manno-octulosonate cytidylyltransferase [Planctomycetota bacterium]|nr:3-deoxy-manno-octulosonate cytidylyltransferase [Planctomycetota bacterium]
MSNVAAIIPARYAASRLPGKPLLQDTGKFLIQHVYESVSQCSSIDRVLVATDDQRIEDAVRSFGGEVVMTSPEHPNGTCRIAEVAKNLDSEIVLNVQGDEPEVRESDLEKLVEGTRKAEMATLATPFQNREDIELPERVKVVRDEQGYATSFSRKPIPDGENLLHVGLYGFQREFLLRFAEMAESPMEKQERLEQLRAMENGIRIQVGVIDGNPWGGIDTPGDYRAFVERWRERVQ